MSMAAPILTTPHSHSGKAFPHSVLHYRLLWYVYTGISATFNLLVNWVHSYAIVNSIGGCHNFRVFSISDVIDGQVVGVD